MTGKIIKTCAIAMAIICLTVSVTPCVHASITFERTVLAGESAPSGTPDVISLEAMNTINIDFGAIGTGPNESYAGAGMAGYWNVIDAVSSSPVGGILDGEGNATPVTLATTQNMFDVTPSSQPFDTQDAAVLGDYLVGGRNTFTLNIQGLLTGGYYLIVYTTGRQDFPRSSTITPFGESSITATNTGIYTDGLEQGVTHSIHEVVVTGNGLTIDINSPADGFTNGIQLLYIPEPATIVTTAFISVLTLRGRVRS